MPFLRLWRYRPAPGRETEFVSAYGADGNWARLFRRADGYLGTVLLPGAPGSGIYLTIDRWQAEADWDRFLAAPREEYHRLDQLLAPLCVEDVEIASFAES